MVFCFFFNDTATTEIYTLSLHDALPICFLQEMLTASTSVHGVLIDVIGVGVRSEEHTSELQSHSDLVCRLLLEKKKGDNPVSTVVDNGSSDDTVEKIQYVFEQATNDDAT